MTNLVSRFGDTDMYRYFFDKIVDCGTSDINFFTGHKNIGGYYLQQIPSEFAAYLCFLHDEFLVCRKPCNYLEIGSCGGGSLRHIHESFPNFKLHSIDAMTYSECIHQAHNFAEFKDELQQHIGDSKSVDTYRWLSDMNYLFDVIFIDGSHDHHDVISDFFCIRPFLKKDGHIVFHDYRWEDRYCHVPEAFNYLVKSNMIKVIHEIFEPEEKSLGIAITSPY